MGIAGHIRSLSLGAADTVLAVRVWLAHPWILWGPDPRRHREGRFAYRFSASALRKESWDWVYPMKMLILIGILVLLTGGLLAVGPRDVPKSMKDLWTFAYLFGYACFAFAAIVRSQVLLVWCWIPDGPEGRTRRVWLPRRRERALSSAR